MPQLISTLNYTTADENIHSPYQPRVALSSRFESRSAEGKIVTAGLKTEKSMRVMIVDDDPFVREVAVAALGVVPGVLLTACAGGAEALAALDAAAPDLILLDLMMPGMDGRALWTEIRARGGAPRAIFLTGRDDEATRAEIMALGAQGLIAKPFDPGALAATVLDLDHKAKARAARLEALTHDFAAHLPAAGAAIAVAWEDGAVETLLVEVHRIAGVAPMFGFAAVGKAADRAEEVLRAGMVNGWCDGRERAVVEEAVRGVIEAIREIDRAG